jgi:uncharacterized protein
MQSHPRQKILSSNGAFVQRLMLMPDKCNIQRERHNFMTGLIFKNCDTFSRRVCIYLRFTSGLTSGFAALGLSGFLPIACDQVWAQVWANDSQLPLASSNLASLNAAFSPSPSGIKVRTQKFEAIATSKPESKVTPKISIAKDIPKDIDKPQYLPITAKAKIAGRVINLEVTRSVAEQAKGLMFREALPDNRGMLFNFNPPQTISFWMKNVPVPLDMVFIYEGKVVAIAANATPCKAEPCNIYPNIPVLTDRVIELRAGWARQMKLKVGDKVVVEALN